VRAQLDIACLYQHAVVVSEAPVTLVDAQLFPEELAYVASAVPKRRAEFGTARVCARQALAQFGVVAGPLVPATDRAPVWPPGFVGSISHADDWCAVVVCPTTQARGIGLDLERDDSAAAELEALICTAGEREWLAEQELSSRRHLRTLLFSAKEAAYKCQYPLTRQILGFLDLEVQVDLEAEQFSVRAVAQDSRLVELTQRMAGRMLWRDGLVFTAASL